MRLKIIETSDSVLRDGKKTKVTEGQSQIARCAVSPRDLIACEVRVGERTRWLQGGAAEGIKATNACGERNRV